MDDLRWILLIIGVLVIGAVYGFTRWQESRRRSWRGRDDSLVDDADIEDALRELDEVVVERAEPNLRAEDLESIPLTPDEALEPPAPAQQVVETPLEEALPAGLEEKLIVLNVAATEERLFSGRHLLEALEAVGMSYGEHAIYHRLLESHGRTISLFSAANILQPGTFEPEQIDGIRSPGLALFLQLPGPYDGLAAFEEMLDTARRLAGMLEIKLLDERRCILTNQAIEHIREDLREYRRLSHLRAKQG